MTGLDPQSDRIIEIATIVTDAEFKGPKQDLRWHGINDDAMINMFNFLGASASRRERWYQLQPVTSFV